jgi:hypothetical protein
MLLMAWAFQGLLLRGLIVEHKKHAHLLCDCKAGQGSNQNHDALDPKLGAPGQQGHTHKRQAVGSKRSENSQAPKHADS